MYVHSCAYIICFVYTLCMYSCLCIVYIKWIACGVCVHVVCIEYKLCVICVYIVYIIDCGVVSSLY